jgi:hypothetical protein
MPKILKAQNYYRRRLPLSDAAWFTRHPHLRNTFRYTILAAGCACLVLAQPASAQHDAHGFHGGDFHGRKFYAFTPHERGIWLGGHWQHGWHDNRFAWWWVAGGGWYFYPIPTYAYPTSIPPPIIVPQLPAVPTGLPPAQFWYYCDNPAGYHPHVAACNGQWRQVPATSPQ